MAWSSAAFPQRYGVYIADFNPTVGAELRKVRPVVVVSRNEMNQFLDTVVVCPLTTVLHPRWRGRLQVRCAGKDAEIAVDQIRTVSKRRLGQATDRLSAEAAARLRRLITEMYGE
ncbi:MAG: type II toxin-antitoxin system PemK/MazF family toxin [Acidobacteria bacterium]|nr:type II toxin-antitoxin system PemK/MazF family toxin [Acidobacteriota bacterium]